MVKAVTSTTKGKGENVDIVFANKGLKIETIEYMIMIKTEPENK